MQTTFGERSETVDHHVYHASRSKQICGQTRFKASREVSIKRQAARSLTKRNPKSPRESRSRSRSLSRKGQEDRARGRRDARSPSSGEKAHPRPVVGVHDQPCCGSPHRRTSPLRPPQPRSASSTKHRRLTPATVWFVARSPTLSRRALTELSLSFTRVRQSRNMGRQHPPARAWVIANIGRCQRCQRLQRPS